MYIIICDSVVRSTVVEHYLEVPRELEISIVEFKIIKSIDKWRRGGQCTLVMLFLKPV